MENPIVSFIAWVIRPALRKLMKEHYNRNELTDSEKQSFRNFAGTGSVDVSPEYIEQWKQRYEKLNDWVHRQERPEVKKTARSNEDYTDEAKVLLEIGLIDPSDSRAATYPLDPALLEAVRSEITSLREMKRRYQCFQSLLGCHVEKQDQQQIHS